MTTPWPRRLLRQLRTRLRLLLATLGALLLYALLPSSAGSEVSRLLISWNVLVALYLVLTARLMITANIEQVRQRAYAHDEGQNTMLLLTIAAVGASLVAIVMELGHYRQLPPSAQSGALLLTLWTVASSWVFMHLMFALHYAHEYYLNLRRARDPGLAFPGTQAPDYGDFLYAAFIIGTSAQTADVAYTSRDMRRIGAVHAVLAFVYNTSVLALSINLGASLL